MIKKNIISVIGFLLLASTSALGKVQPSSQKVDNILDEYCSLEKPSSKASEKYSTLLSTDPNNKLEIKKAAKISRDLERKKTVLSNKYQKLTGNYPGSTACDLRGAPKVIIDPVEKIKVTVGQVECARKTELGPDQFELFNGLLSNGCLENEQERQSALSKLGKCPKMFEAEQSAAFVLSAVAHDPPTSSHFSKEARARAAKLVEYYVKVSDGVCKGEIKGTGILGDRTSDLCMEKNNLNSLYVMIAIPIENIRKVACTEDGKVARNDKVTAISLYEQRTGQKPNCDGK